MFLLWELAELGCNNSSADLVSAHIETTSFLFQVIRRYPIDKHPVYLFVVYLVPCEGLVYGSGIGSNEQGGIVERFCGDLRIA